MKKSALILFFITVTQIITAHPLKMAYTSVKYNAKKQVFEISHRVFQDDFELSLQQNNGYKGKDIFHERNDPVVRKVIDMFFQHHFSIVCNNRPLKMKYIKTEQQHQMGNVVWYESEKVNIKEIKKISVSNSILMDTFKEQVNMFNLNINSNYIRTIKFEYRKRSEVLKI